MKHFIYVALFACLTNTVMATATLSGIKSIPPQEKRYQVAVDFVNAYIQNCNNLNKSEEIRAWVKNNSMVTDSFKKEVIAMVTQAWKDDPELGLDADPIFDAQDFPEEGVKLLQYNENTGYVEVQGIQWTDFKLTVKVITQNGKILVDGCGIINIPESERSAR
ncbi:hypothetical protein ACG2LH_02770 [Zhouia sp. PK063]|uniref:hypothetical protein n=1 Tax=Zhouia sp. PK063 TaxID=3373602 RepID=UPI0037BADB03